METAQTGRQSNGTWCLIEKEPDQINRNSKQCLNEVWPAEGWFSLLFVWERGENLLRFDALENPLPNQMVGFCLIYQSRRDLFTHVCLYDKQIVAITLWVGERAIVLFPSCVDREAEADGESSVTAVGDVVNIKKWWGGGGGPGGWANEIWHGRWKRGFRGPARLRT